MFKKIPFGKFKGEPIKSMYTNPSIEKKQYVEWLLNQHEDTFKNYPGFYEELIDNYNEPPLTKKQLKLFYDHQNDKILKAERRKKFLIQKHGINGNDIIRSIQQRVFENTGEMVEYIKI